MKFHSSVGTAAYHDLRRSLLDDRVSEIIGQPTRVKVRGRIFWYDKYRIGNDIAQRYIGPDSDELRSRLDRIAELKSSGTLRQSERTRLVRILRSEGYKSTDAKVGSLLNAFARTGLFRLGGTLVGTVAFQHYEGELGVVMGFDQLAQTDDIDIASFERLSFAIDDQVETPLEQVFDQLKFEPVPSLHKTATWRWKQSDSNTVVEFLMPATRDETLRDLPALGVSAQALRHLDYLIEDPIPAVSLYRSGVLVQIPRPERYAIHKLIVAERRRGGPDMLKARKDRAQAEFLIEALTELRPDELAEAYEIARSRGPQWRAQLDASLKRSPRSLSLLG